MKKVFLGALMFFAMQSGFAQSQDAKTYVANMNIKSQIESYKTQLLPAIDAAKVEDFTKEFDTTVNDFVTSFTKMVDENYNAADIKAANKAFADTKQLTPATPKDAAGFQEKVNTLQNELGMALQGIVMKYADAAAIGAEE